MSSRNEVYIVATRSQWREMDFLTGRHWLKAARRLRYSEDAVENETDKEVH
jgi:hypothetical protein